MFPDWLLGPFAIEFSGPMFDRIVRWLLAVCLPSAILVLAFRQKRWSWMLALLALAAWIGIGWWLTFTASV
jgi:hypothetical protein